MGKKLLVSHLKQAECIWMDTDKGLTTNRYIIENETDLDAFFADEEFEDSNLRMLVNPIRESIKKGKVALLTDLNSMSGHPTYLYEKDTGLVRIKKPVATEIVYNRIIEKELFDRFKALVLENAPSEHATESLDNWVDCYNYWSERGSRRLFDKCERIQFLINAEKDSINTI